MIAIILVMAWCGVKLDKVLGLTTPIFTIILSLLGVFAGIYTAIKDFIEKGLSQERPQKGGEQKPGNILRELFGR